jgi:hypothetical protein
MQLIYTVPQYGNIVEKYFYNIETFSFLLATVCPNFVGRARATVIKNEHFRKFGKICTAAMVISKDIH